MLRYFCKYNTFAGQKILLDDEVELDVLVVGATDTKIRRPKKNKKTTTRENVNATPSKAN